MTPADEGGATTGQDAPTRDEALRIFRQMLRIRVFEEHANELYLTAKMPGLTHMYTGQEAVAVGVCDNLRREDAITSTHRGHGHCVAKGASLDRMFAELLGRRVIPDVDGLDDRTVHCLHDVRGLLPMQLSECKARLFDRCIDLGGSVVHEDPDRFGTVHPLNNIAGERGRGISWAILVLHEAEVVGTRAGKVPSVLQFCDAADFQFHGIEV